MAVRFIGSGYSDRAEILGLIIDFFCREHCVTYTKMKFGEIQKLGKILLFFQFWTNHGRSRPLNEKLSWFRLNTQDHIPKVVADLEEPLIFLNKIIFLISVVFPTFPVFPFRRNQLKFSFNGRDRP